MSKPDLLSPVDFEILRNSGRCIDNKHGYPAVILHPDDTVTKVWPRSRSVLSTLFCQPNAVRFVENASRLRALKIPVPTILQLARIEGTKVHVVRYTMLPGPNFRELLTTAPTKADIPALACFFHQLHQLGIYHRCAHFGNVIVTPHDGFGLIDFDGAYFRKRPLSLKARAANLAVPIRYRYKKDQAALRAAGGPDLIEAYLELTTWDARRQGRFRDLVERRR